MSMRERRLSKTALEPRPASRKRQLLGFLILPIVAASDAKSATESGGRKRSLRANKDGISSLQRDDYPGVLSDMDGVIREQHLFDPFHLHPATPGEPSAGADANDFDWVGQKRIFGGDDAAFGRYFHFAKFRFGNMKCGGSVVHPEFILTAAHCVAFKEPVKEEIFIGAYKYDHTTLKSTNYTEKRYWSHKFVHPSYEGNNFDFALLQLTEQTAVTPVDLDDGTYDKTFVDLTTSLTTIGLGSTELNPTVFPNTLQDVSLPYMSNENCASRWGASKITDQMICAGGEEGVDSCGGDSGGPLLYLINPNTDKEMHVQVGVTSWGASNCGTKHYPGVYARVSKVREWIDEIISKNPVPSPSQAPSAAPTGFPSHVPSDSPTNIPSAAPTQIPTPNCKDDPTWTYVNHNNVAKHCNWVYNKPEKKRCTRKGTLGDGTEVEASIACPGACAKSCTSG